MEADKRLAKALEAASDALQHLTMSLNLDSLDCTHIDRLLWRVVDLPTEGTQRNSRRNLLVIRQWMVTDGPGVVLLEVLGQLYWRLGELNSKQFETFRAALQQQPSYYALQRDRNVVTLVIQRIHVVQRSKADACREFLSEFSDFIGTDMDEKDVLRTTPSRPLTPQSIHSQEGYTQESGLLGIIKYIPPANSSSENVERILTELYVHGICPGRTVATQSNCYTLLSQEAESSLSTKYALLSLAASYICDYLPKQREFYHQAELYYSTEALKALAAQISKGENYGAAVATSMLLMHHDAISQGETPLCWSCHANVFNVIPSKYIDYKSDPALFIRTQLVLAHTAQSSEQLQSSQQHSFEAAGGWLDGVHPTEAMEISGTLGFSPQLLSIVSTINSLATTINNSNKQKNTQRQETLLQDLKQWTSEPRGPEQEILLATAEAFRLAALIYLRCRLYGYTRFHASILELSSTLRAVLLSLPVQGVLYTAIYPIWPLFIATVTTDANKRDMLYQRVVPIREGDRNTLPAVLRRVSGLRSWLAGQDAGCQRCENWWDEMLDPSSSTVSLGGNMLCLG